VTYIAGTEANTFLTYIDVKTNEVLSPYNNTSGAQYAAVSFALRGGFSPNLGTGLVPKSSVQVGIGASLTGVTWISSCEQPISAQYVALIEQPCGPSVIMCSASMSDRYRHIALLPQVVCSPACLTSIQKPTLFSSLVFMNLI